MDINLKDNKLNKEIAVGFDLSNSFSQVSYGYIDEENVETIPCVAGTHNYMVPTALFKRREVNQWFVGREAVKNKGVDGFFVDDIVKKAVAGEDVMVGDESFRPSALIALFMKRTLALVNMIAPINKIGSFMVTVDTLDTTMVSVLSEAVASLGLKTSNIFFQSHMESFYHYMIFQERTLWMHDVILLDFSDEILSSLRMECNNNTTPVVAFIDPNTHTGFKTSLIDTLTPESVEARTVDGQLSDIVSELTEGRVISSVFFIGDRFKQDIFKESVKLMCRKGRVFEGNNLFSKGAAYSARNKVKPGIIGNNYVFLGNDKLKSNIGMNVRRRGENGYLALLDAGVNWFEAQKECEFYLDQGNKISFVITPLTGKSPELVDITLSDLPKRPIKTTRLNLSVKMISESKMQVTVRDLGFGELFPSSNIEWKEVINV